MPKWLKVCLWVAAAVVYLNIGYLCMYSFDSTASQTALSNSVYKTVDFMGYIGRPGKGALKNWLAYFILYGLFSLFWPFILLICWTVNFAVLSWKVLVWLATGGFWKWLGLLK